MRNNSPVINFKANLPDDSHPSLSTRSDDYPCRHRLVGAGVDEDEGSGLAVAAIGIVDDRLGGAQGDAADVVHREGAGLRALAHCSVNGVRSGSRPGYVRLFENGIQPQQPLPSNPSPPRIPARRRKSFRVFRALTVSSTPSRERSSFPEGTRWEAPSKRPGRENGSLHCHPGPAGTSGRSPRTGQHDPAP